jgi:pyruvate/2-oxoglutarate dehydrogenase complex dihydrolipoamide dehydrogenase (E3) component
MPETLRTRFVKSHLPPEGAWWLRERVENRVPVHVSTTVEEARETAAGVILKVKDANGTREIEVDQVVAGSGYDLNVRRLAFLDPALRTEIELIEGSPRLNGTFESSVPGLRFIGPISGMSFGPLFRFVAGAEYSGLTVAGHLAARAATAPLGWKAPSAT